MWKNFKYVLVIFALVVVLAFLATANARNPTTIPSTRLSLNNAVNACNANVHLVDTASLTCSAFEVYVSRGDSMRVSLTWDRSGLNTNLYVWVDTSPDGDAPWSLEATPILNASGTGQIDLKPGSMLIDVTDLAGSISWEFTSFTSVYARFRFEWVSGGPNDVITVTTQHR
jgi:hypothetical protein